MKHSIRLFILFALFLPAIAYANGGGPILLFISGTAFLYGQIWILGAETFLLNKFSELTLKEAFVNVFFANVVSTLVIGFGFPLLLAIVTAFGMFLPEPYGQYSSAIGTWAYDSAPFMEYLGYISLVWLLVTFLLTVICEKKFYVWYWNKKGFKPNFSINKFLWSAHTLSYAGLLIIIFVMWHDIFNM